VAGSECSTWNIALYLAPSGRSAQDLSVTIGLDLAAGVQESAVYLLGTLRWVATLLARQPLVWLGGALLAALWPLVVMFTPLGLTTGGGAERELLYEVAFISLLLGQLVGMVLLERAGWILESVTGRRRLVTELAALTTAAGLLLAAALAGTLLTAEGRALLDTELLRRVCLSHLHLAGVSLLLMRAPARPVVLLVGLPALTWALPAFLGSEGWLGRSVSHILGATRHLTIPLEVHQAGAHWGLGLLPIIGLIGTALALSRPGLHALRHPR